MELHNLRKTTTKSLRRVGRGHGSGRVKTSGRGTKGQKARRDIKLHFEGGALPLIKRLPFLKGKGRNKTLQVKPVIVNLKDLKNAPAKTVIDMEYLIRNRIINESDAKANGVKVLGSGDIKVALTVNLPVSAAVKEKIEKAGGTVSV